MRPGRGALTTAAFCVFDAGIAYACGAHRAALIIAGLGAAALILLWRAHDTNNDIEALIKATRENAPDHVPAEWVKEFLR